MLIDLTQHATRCSDSSGQAQEYLIARHAAVETETVLVQICLELGAPSVICSLKECFQITDCLVYPMQIICFVFLCVQFHTLQIQVASVTVAFYLRFWYKILVDDFLQSLSLYVIYCLHPGKQWCTVCGFGYGPPQSWPYPYHDLVFRYGKVRQHSRHPTLQCRKASIFRLFDP